MFRAKQLPYATQHPPPGPIFKARLLRTQHDSNTNRHVFGKLSARSFQRPPCLISTLILMCSNRALKIGPGGVVSCVTYGKHKREEAKVHAHTSACVVSGASLSSYRPARFRFSRPSPFPDAAAGAAVFPLFFPLLVPPAIRFFKAAISLFAVTMMQRKKEKKTGTGARR